MDDADLMILVSSILIAIGFVLGVLACLYVIPLLTGSSMRP